MFTSHHQIPSFRPPNRNFGDLVIPAPEPESIGAGKPVIPAPEPVFQQHRHPTSRARLPVTPSFRLPSRYFSDLVIPASEPESIYPTDPQFSNLNG